MRPVLLAVLLFSFAQTGAQQAAYSHPRWYDGGKLEQSLARAPAGAACAETYRSLLRDDQVRVSIFFGFNELTHSGIVVDPFNVRLFLQRLQAPCRQSTGAVAACGFDWQGRPARGDEPFVLYKRIEQAGRSIDVRLQLFDSAVTDDYRHILEHLRERQEIKSARVRSHFMRALAEDDVVFYQGHSRLGTGPGFGPFDDFSERWWRAMLFTPNRDDMLDALRGRTEPLPLLGLYGCDTQQHYGRALANATPATATLLSSGTTYTDADSARLFGTLDAILAQHCETELTQGLLVEGDNASYRLSGWFRPRDPLPEENFLTQYH